MANMPDSAAKAAAEFTRTVDELVMRQLAVPKLEGVTFSSDQFGGVQVAGGGVGKGQSQER